MGSRARRYYVRESEQRAVERLTEWAVSVGRVPSHWAQYFPNSTSRAQRCQSDVEFDAMAPKPGAEAEVIRSGILGAVVWGSSSVFLGIPWYCSDMPRFSLIFQDIL